MISILWLNLMSSENCVVWWVQFDHLLDSALLSSFVSDPWVRRWVFLLFPHRLTSQVSDRVLKCNHLKKWLQSRVLKSKSLSPSDNLLLYFYGYKMKKCITYNNLPYGFNWCFELSVCTGFYMKAVNWCQSPFPIGEWVGLCTAENTHKCASLDVQEHKQNRKATIITFGLGGLQENMVCVWKMLFCIAIKSMSDTTQVLSSSAASSITEHGFS